MTYVLDTNTCIAALRLHRTVLTRLLRVPPGQVSVSAMTVAELWFGALQSDHPARSRATTDAFLAPFRRLPFAEAAAEHYATARRHLEAAGTPIGERDLVIAATALAHDLTVITNNTRQFGRVPGLRVEDWSR